MEEPTKADIDAIFKRLKTLSANKVCRKLSNLLFLFSYTEFVRYRYVSIVKRKIQHGHLSLMESLYVSIVQQDIVDLVFISHLFVQLILIRLGDGFNFGRITFKSRNSFDLFLWCHSSAMQVGGNANAVCLFYSFPNRRLWV